MGLPHMSLQRTARLLLSTLTKYSPDRDQDTALMDELKESRLLKGQSKLSLWLNTCGSLKAPSRALKLHGDLYKQQHTSHSGGVCSLLGLELLQGMPCSLTLPSQQEHCSLWIMANTKSKAELTAFGVPQGAELEPLIFRTLHWQ